MAGGTFTISNGGVYGSLFGTPIINPPQSAILGMHATKMRPVAVNVSDPCLRDGRRRAHALTLPLAFHRERSRSALSCTWL